MLMARETLTVREFLLSGPPNGVLETSWVPGRDTPSNNKTITLIATLLKVSSRITTTQMLDPLIRGMHTSGPESSSVKSTKAGLAVTACENQIRERLTFQIFKSE